MITPFVSVIIPAFNREKYAARAVASVLNQTYKNLEVIVVDDGSTDGTVASLAPFGNRIRLICQANGGVSAARNTGIRAAQGNWIAFLDSDDWWKPGKLERQMQLMGKYGVKMCFTRCETNAGELWRDIDEITSIDKEPGVKYVADAATSVCQASRHPYMQSLVIEKHLMEKVGMFDESLSNGDDTQLIFKLSYYTGFLYLDESLVVIHIDTDNSLTYQRGTKSSASRLNAYLRVQVEMYWRLLLENPAKAAISRQRLAYFSLRRGQLACATGDNLLARTLARDAMIMSRSLRIFLAGAALYAFPWLMRRNCRKRFNLP